MCVWGGLTETVGGPAHMLGRHHDSQTDPTVGKWRMKTDLSLVFFSFLFAQELSKCVQE